MISVVRLKSFMMFALMYADSVVLYKSAWNQHFISFSSESY